MKNLKANRICEIIFLFTVVSILFLIPSNPVFGKPPCDSSSDANIPILTLDPIPSKIYAGETITFTGHLLCKNGIPYPNAVIEIIQDDFIDQQFLVSGFTDEQGKFSIPWKVKAGEIEKDLDIEAKFTPDPVNGMYWATKSQQMTVLRGDASIILNQLPKSAEIGQVLIFSGTLQLQYGSPEGHVVYIKDEDPLESDDLLATAYVNSDGSYSANWIVTNIDDDRIADIYAVFEGFNIYHRVTTCDIGYTSTLGGSCQYTVKLQITGEIPPPPPPPTTTDYDNDGIDDFYDQCKNSPETYNGYQDNDGCPDSAPSKPTKEILNGNEYVGLYYSHSFEKTPLVAIVPDPDSYDKVKVYSIPVQEGIRIWESELQGKFGGNWNTDFEIIDPLTKFDKKPDIIMNLVTRENVAGCGKDFGGLAYVSTIKPVNTIVCTTGGNYFYSSSTVSATSSHEFIHAMGLGHAFNKVGDLMCSVENGKPTCGNQFYASGSTRPSDFDLTAVAKIYGEDGFKDPNNKVLWGTKFTADEYINKKNTIDNSLTIQQKSKDLAKQKADELAKQKADELAKQKADELAKQKADELAKQKADELAKQKAKEKSNVCNGTRLCIVGKVVNVIDGDTLKVENYKIRLSLTDAPERNESDYKKATKFTKKLCSIGSTVIVDQDDKQPYDKFKRVVGKVTCSGKVLNAELLYNGHANISKQYCSKSEFANENWAKKYGC